jgi:hypothetical protein
MRLAKQVFAPGTWRSWLWTRAVFAGATSVVTVAFLGFADGETVGDGGMRMLLLCGPLWLVPIAIYFFFPRTLFGIVVVGLSLFAATTLALEAVFADTHSTAAFGLLGVPFYFAFWIGVYLALEWSALTLVRRFGRDQWRRAPRGPRAAG